MLASALYNIDDSSSEYFKNKKNIDEERLKNSTTLYIGNLSFYTLESKIYNLFSQCGVVKKVIIGLNKNTKFPCGFCFVEYYLREHAQKAVNILNHASLDNRVIRVDWDVGFEEGRQYGRGFTGGQKRDEFMKSYDPDRPRQKDYGNGSYNQNRNYDRSRYDNRDNRDNKDFKYSRDNNNGYGGFRSNKNWERGDNNNTSVNNEGNNYNKDRVNSFLGKKKYN